MSVDNLQELQWLRVEKYKQLLGKAVQGSMLHAMQGDPSLSAVESPKQLAPLHEQVPAM